MNNKDQLFRKGQSGRSRRIIWLLLFMLIGIYLLSFTLGRLSVPIGQVLRILLSRLVNIPKMWDDAMESAVLRVRLPRITMAAFVGCCLSAAGASYQGVFQNPMASPDILGASNGAAFGAALAILLGAGAAMTSGFAFLFSIVTVSLAFVIARKARGQPITNLILAGIMLGSLMTAATSYLKLVADPNEQLPKITYWLMGSLNGIKLRQLYAVLPMLAGLIPLLLVRWRINLLALGDDEAHTMGINVNRLRLLIVICATLITASSVSVSGMIGWVGLVIPHFSRKLVGSNYRYLMPASMMAGAAFLIVVDDVSRNLLTTEIPIGILTAFIGAPFFIYLLCRREKTF